jgi:oligoendopeptidase F
MVGLCSADRQGPLLPQQWPTKERPMKFSRQCRALLAFACLNVVTASTANAAAPAPTPAKAAAPAPALNWDLSDLYPDEQSWRAAYDHTRAAAQKLGAMKGSIDSAAQLFAVLDANSTATREYLRVAVHAGLAGDQDMRVAPNQERDQLGKSLGTELGEQTAWLAPEILALGADKIRSYIASDPRIADRFGFYLDDLLRSAPHVLGTEAEGVLAAAGNLLQQPDTLHSQFANAEMPFLPLTLQNGQKVKLGAAAFEKYRQVGNRIDRKATFDAYFGSWKKYEGSYGTMLAAQVMGDEFRAKARKYDNALSSALFGDNMPESVYRTLVAEANAALPTLHRYLRLRKQVLGIKDELRYYDNYPPLFPLASAPTFSIDDSKRITLAALAPLGEEYLSELRTGFNGKWMSVYPAQGKKSGAYMSGSAYDVHPYLLLNHNDDFQSLSTFAHEWGHAVHTQLTRRAQPFEKSNYPTFTAESASIGNEMLLSDYMVANAKTRAEKLYYLGAAVESIRTTYFRQVMFSEFELAIHEEMEQGKPLSGQRMTDMYCGLLRKYYGEQQGVMKIDPAYCVEWAWIPHFYYDFYLYQYATSMAGAAHLTAAIKSDGAPARERFLALLRAGGSDYPYALYQQAGLDMATGTAYRALAARMNGLLDQIEQLRKTE